MQSELEILRDVSEKLTSQGIAFMLTGSLAMSHYAQPRMTRDIDIVVALKMQDTDKIVRLFEREYYVSAEAVLDAVQRGTMFNVIHFQSVVKVDFILLNHSNYEDEKFNRRRNVNFGGFETSLISREDLILSKLMWAQNTGSEMQLKDVRNLLGPGCDMDYLRKWSEKLGVVEDLESQENAGA